MAKAIVRINAFLDRKQTKEVYNLIYDQVKSGLEVIVIPSYCDVYVLNGAEIEVQKKERYSGKSVEKICNTCKHAESIDSCRECVYLSECAFNNMSHWEAKENE